MCKLLKLIVALLVVSLFAPAHAGPIQIEWKDLQPSHPELNQELNSLDVKAKERVREALLKRQYLIDIERGALLKGALRGKDAQILNADYSDLDDLVRRMVDFEAERAVKLSHEMLNKKVRIDGFLLPTRFKKGVVVQFLLVPFVGACIHVPPPPPNQIILVDYPKGFRSVKAFEAVTYEGTLDSLRAEVELEFVDGNDLIDVGYLAKSGTVSIRSQ